VAVCKRAEFVCHTPDHNKGGKVKMDTTRQVGEEKNEEGKAEIGNIDVLQHHFPLWYNDI
jgi:hypothetical protein